MLYKTISSKTIIQRVMSRFGIKENIELDAMEWIGDAIGLIGTHVGYLNKVEAVDVDFHKIPHPCDFYQLNFILFNGRKLVHGRKGTPSHKGHSSDDPIVIELVKTIFAGQGLAQAIEEGVDCCDYNKLEDLTNQQYLWRHRVEDLVNTIDRSPNYCEGDEWYTDGLKDCFDTSIECGTVYISYKAYPVDAQGFPLIIDEVKYKLALDWYVVRCLMERGFRHPTLSYEVVDFKTNKAITAASNEHLKMTYEEMEEFISSWTYMLNSRRDNITYYSN